MEHEGAIGNPFMLMLNPEIVLAAVEKSERLGQLNRHLCRPLDKPVGTAGKQEVEVDLIEDDDDAIIVEGLQD